MTHVAEATELTILTRDGVTLSLMDQPESSYFSNSGWSIRLRVSLSIISSVILSCNRKQTHFVYFGYTVYKVGLLSVTKLCEEFVVLHGAVRVEDETVDGAVRYPRTHHAHHSSPSGTEYLPGDTNLHRVTI